MKLYKNRYTVGITGHRDLLENELDVYKKEIQTYLTKLKKNAAKPLLLISPLADGADRLFIKAGKELGLDYVALLPLPMDMYKNDFSSDSLDEFNSLLIGAREYKICNFIEDNNRQNCKEYGENRDKQYLKVGQEIAKCDAMIALWDGTDNGKMGGTADIVKYRKNMKKSYYHIQVKRKK